VHHGGAGTTAISLAKGRPTVVVPFFGDQGFWGKMIQKAGAGPKPIPHKKLTVDNLSDAIKYAISHEAKEAARKMSQDILNDNGVQNGAQSFYRHLPLLNMRCELDPFRLAVWWSTRHCLKLSAFAAQTLANAGLIDVTELELHRTKEYRVARGLSFKKEASSVLESITGVADNLLSPVKGVFETTVAVPRGIMRIVTASSGSSNPKRSVEKKKDPPQQRQTMSSVVHGVQRALLAGYSDSVSRLFGGEEKTKKDGGMGEQIKGKARELYRSGFRAVESHIERVELHRREARVQEGVDAFNNSTDAERVQIIKSFREAKDTLLERKATYIKAAKKVLESQEQLRKVHPITVASPEATKPADGPEEKKVDIVMQENVDWDTVYEGDLAQAMKNSLQDTTAS